MVLQGYRAKRVLGLCCRWSGLIAARWRLLAPAIYVLNYHRIGDSHSTAFDPGNFSCNEARFRLHLEMISERFNVINLDCLTRLIARGTLPGGKPVAVITFDDGYADNHSIAFPLLKEFGVTATFFLPTAFIGTLHIPWWDEIAWRVRHASRTHLSLPGLTEPAELDLRNCDQTVRRVLQWARSQCQPMQETLQMVQEATGAPDAVHAEKESLFLSWSQVREMSLAGMDIGSHTESHSILSHLTEEAQFRELLNSRRVLEDELGACVDSIAYPVGDATCYTPRTLELARSAGYQLGFNFLGRVQRLPVTHPLNLNRIRMNDHGSPHSTLRGLITFPTLAFN